jgi:hypothetical protein
MSVALLLEMAASDAERVGVVTDDQRLTVGELNALADGGAGVIAASGAGSVVYVGLGGAMLPLLIFASARAARAFTPLNYRLSGEALAELIERLPDPQSRPPNFPTPMMWPWCCSPRAPRRGPKLLS